MACSGSCGEEAQVLAYVGGGRGDYIQETSYKFVGQGAGDFDTVTVNSGYGWCCIGGGICAVLAVVVILIIVLLPGPDTSTTTKPIDCSGPTLTWSPAKKVHCCARVGRGCPTPPPAPTTAAPTTIAPAPPTVTPGTPAPPNECNIGGVADWTALKRDMCCKKYGNGCPGTQPPAPAPLPYDCNAGSQEQGEDDHDQDFPRPHTWPQVLHVLDHGSWSRLLQKFLWKFGSKRRFITSIQWPFQHARLASVVSRFRQLGLGLVCWPLSGCQTQDCCPLFGELCSVHAALGICPASVACIRIH